MKSKALVLLLIMVMGTGAYAQDFDFLGGIFALAGTSYMYELASWRQDNN